MIKDDCKNVSEILELVEPFLHAAHTLCGNRKGRLGGVAGLHFSLARQREVGSCGCLTHPPTELHSPQPLPLRRQSRKHEVR